MNPYVNFSVINKKKSLDVWSCTGNIRSSLMWPDGTLHMVAQSPKASRSKYCMAWDSGCFPLSFFMPYKKAVFPIALHLEMMQKTPDWHAVNSNYKILMKGMGKPGQLWSFFKICLHICSICWESYNSWNHDWIFLIACISAKHISGFVHHQLLALGGALIGPCPRGRKKSRLLGHLISAH